VFLPGRLPVKKAPQRFDRLGQVGMIHQNEQ
jgi:hypothetical protein